MSNDAEAPPSMDAPGEGTRQFLVRMAFDWDVMAKDEREACRIAQREYGERGIMGADVDAEGATPYCERLLPNGQECGAPHDPNEECPYTPRA
jgi:hypothetical protein